MVQPITRKLILFLYFQLNFEKVIVEINEFTILKVFGVENSFVYAVKSSLSTNRKLIFFLCE